MIDLSQPATMLSQRFGVDIQTVRTLCPQDLIGAAGNYARRYTALEIDELMLEWCRKVEMAAKNKNKHKNECDAKRLKYFRRKYGPHITMEHLPRAAK